MGIPETRSRWHRRLDGLAVWLHPSRRHHRNALLDILDRAAREWQSADYGSGYLYQSFPELGLHGFRQTDKRRAQMDIDRALAGKRVLEVGCNTGFLSLALATEARRYVAFDNNPFLIEIAQLTQRTVGNTSIEFRVDTMEDFVDPGRFDVILSFANHSTWDGNMTLALDGYFAKLRGLLDPGGTLFFESHHPKLENTEQLAQTFDTMSRFFLIDEQWVLTQGSAWDRGRTVVRARALA